MQINKSVSSRLYPLQRRPRNDPGTRMSCAYATAIGISSYRDCLPSDNGTDVDISNAEDVDVS